MGPLGVPELIFILVLALLIFGPRKLPEIGRTLGKAMGEFRRATTDLKRSLDTEIALEEKRTPPPAAPRREPAEPAAPPPAAAPSAAAGEAEAEPSPAVTGTEPRD